MGGGIGEGNGVCYAAEVEMVYGGGLRHKDNPVSAIWQTHIRETGNFIPYCSSARMVMISAPSSLHLFYVRTSEAG